MAPPVTVNEILDGHVGLDLECLDRIYLNAYVPNLQVGGQVVSFLTAHLGNPIPSPAIFDKIGSALRGGGAVRRRRAHRGGPVRQDRPQDRCDAALPGPAGGHRPARGGPRSGWPRSSPRCLSAPNARAPTGCRGSPLPRPTGGSAATTSISGTTSSGRPSSRSARTYPAKVWVNGHEWAKRQALRAGVGFTELSNGFAATTDPTRLQAICDRLDPATIEAFVERWLAVLPLPLTDADRAAGLCSVIRHRGAARYTGVPTGLGQTAVGAYTCTAPSTSRVAKRGSGAGASGS
jgi:hypothetical protein